MHHSRYYGLKIWSGCVLRPQEPPDEPLTKEELAQMKQGLSLISPHGVAQQYQRVYEGCRMTGDRLPRASAIQQLVAASYQLWKWRRG
jgi:hypothetical protein